MAFDGIVTRAVVSELNGCLLNGKINKNKFDIDFCKP